MSKDKILNGYVSHSVSFAITILFLTMLRFRA